MTRLHGWPYDIHSFADVAEILGAKGYRVIIPRAISTVPRRMV